MDTLQSLEIIILIMPSNGYITKPDNIIYQTGVAAGIITISLEGYIEKFQRKRKTVEKTIHIVFPSDLKAYPKNR
ncbi:hypothetical protein V7O62_02200 [Methanolobus sp. ZRKC2]|uniref:hypothetical protein n=1 Tax=Methanolobus sp. ZRKC2 TaxID=3125783 RepID=UPI0032452C14